MGDQPWRYVADYPPEPLSGCTRDAGRGRTQTAPGEIHPEAIWAIREDARSAKRIAQDWSCSVDIVYHIQARKSYRDVPERNAVEIPPEVKQRFMAALNELDQISIVSCRTQRIVKLDIGIDQAQSVSEGEQSGQDHRGDVERPRSERLHSLVPTPRLRLGLKH